MRRTARIPTVQYGHDMDHIGLVTQAFVSNCHKDTPLSHGDLVNEDDRNIWLTSMNYELKSFAKNGLETGE